MQQYEELQQKIDRERVEALLLVGRHRLKSNDNGSQTRATFQADNEAIASLEAEKQKIWENLRREDPVLAGEIQVSAPNFSAIQNLIDQPTTAIVSFYTTDNDTHIFIVRQNQITLHTCVGQGDWEREYKMYARFNRLIREIETASEEFPFSHPRYWSGFICQGLR